MIRQQPNGTDLERVSGVVYGVHIHGSLPPEFTPYLPPSSAAAGPRVKRRLALSDRSVGALPGATEFWVNERPDPGAARFSLFDQPHGFGLRVDCLGSGRFRFDPAGIAIDWLSGSPGPAHCFFSHALPLWLSLQGVPVLHASAVLFGNRAVAFVGRSGAGKSTLCAALVRRGHGFVAEDGLPVSRDEHGCWRCLSGPPMLKLWPSALDGCLGTPSAALPRVHASVEKRILWTGSRDTVDKDPPLAAIYVLSRQPPAAGEVTISEPGGSQALMHLLRHGLAALPGAALGLAGLRFQQLSRLVNATRVRCLSYPSGRGHWPGIEAAIVADLAAGEPQSPRLGCADETRGPEAPRLHQVTAYGPG